MIMVINYDEWYWIMIYENCEWKMTMDDYADDGY